MQAKDDEIAELARTVAGLQSALADERSSPTGNGNDVDVDGDELALHDPVVSRVATAGAPRAVAASEPSRCRGERPPLGAARLIVTFFLRFLS